jgi:hypothetical protein
LSDVAGSFLRTVSDQRKERAGQTVSEVPTAQE